VLLPVLVFLIDYAFLLNVDVASALTPELASDPFLMLFYLRPHFQQIVPRLEILHILNYVILRHGL
jgi:hypothetical protein